MRRNRGTLFMIVGALLLLVAIQRIIPTMEEKSDALLAAASDPDETALVTAQAQDAVIETPQMQTIQIEDETYIGVIKIPSLKLELPVMSDWSYPKLVKSPCRYAGSFLDDTLVIAGHSVRAHFRGLRQIQAGASVVFTDAVGNVILYEVVYVEILGSTEVDKLIHNDYDLTLFTCSPGGVRRVVVRCNRV